jgi:hypothetical protein
MPDPDSSTPVLPKQNPRRRGFAIVGALLIFGGIFVAAWLGQGGVNWLLIALGLAAFVALLGWHITGRIGGIFINERNLMILSRFQLAIWTIIILSGFFLIAIGRIRAGSDDPLAIAMDWHLWALMGISTASLIGSPLILNSKKDQQPAPEVMNKAAVILKEPQAEIEKNREGLLYSNTDIGDASFADMFQGDEVQNTYHLDLAKVQMFIFTIIAATAYSAALWNLFDQAKGAPGGLEMMPGVSDGIIALLGISHLGFLSSKGVAHTKTQ